VTASHVCGAEENLCGVPHCSDASGFAVVRLKTTAAQSCRYPRPVDLRGAVIVVTGASRGIGRASAELLGARGTTVVCVGRDASALEELASRLGGTAVVADLGDQASPARVVQQTLAAHGRLDAVVINAGVGHAGPVVEMAPGRIAELVDVNVRGALLLAAASGKAIGTQGNGHGAIVFVSSIAAAVGIPEESVYSATKAALESFAPLLREELGADGITVSTVLPGVVDTDFFVHRGRPYQRRFPRPMPPERVAAAVARALQNGTPRQVVPRWLNLPARLAATAPRLYRSVARHLS